MSKLYREKRKLKRKMKRQKARLSPSKQETSKNFQFVMIQAIAFLYLWNILTHKFSLKIHCLNGQTNFSSHKRITMKVSAGYLNQVQKGIDREWYYLRKDFANYSKLRKMSLQLVSSGVRGKTSHSRHSRSKWKRTRDKFLNSQTTHVCTYCRSNLKAGHPNPRHNLTVDHIIPISKGGAQFDQNNLTLCCMACNQFKSSHLLVA